MRGAYCLIIKVKKNIKEKIGSFGKIEFKRGFYVYVGSAMKNMKKRVERHLKEKKKKFWHIDYLLGNKNVKIVSIFYRESNKKEECKISREISKYGKSIDKFGSSDCKCKSHLFYIDKDSIKKFLNFKNLK